MPRRKTTTSFKYEGGIIRPRGSRFVAEFNIGGKRLRKAVRTHDEGKAWIDEQNRLRMRQGTAGFRLTPRQTQDAADALEEAGGQVTLNDAVKFWSRHHQSVSSSLSVADTHSRLLRQMEDRNLRTRTIRTRRNRLKAFIEEFGDRKLMSLTSGEVEEFVDHQTQRADEPRSSRTRRNLQGELQAFFNAAEKDAGANKGFANTLMKLQAPIRDAKANAIATPANVKKLLRALEKRNGASAVSVAISCFAGLRSAELNGLLWEDIDFDEGEINVRAEIAKTRTSREVPIEPNLRKWLKKYHQESGRVSPSQAVRDDHKLKAIQATGVTWPPNAARHSYGTYYAKHFGSYSLAADRMGHTGGIAMFVKAYKGKCTKQQAAAYWKIVPT